MANTGVDEFDRMPRWMNLNTEPSYTYKVKSIKRYGINIDVKGQANSKVYGIPKIIVSNNSLC